MLHRSSEALVQRQNLRPLALSRVGCLRISPRYRQRNASKICGILANSYAFKLLKINPIPQQSVHQSQTISQMCQEHRSQR